MFDLASDPASQKLIREFFEGGKIVSAVCHGPAAFCEAKLSDDSYLIADQPVTGFSNAEEDGAGLTAAMPFLLQSVLEANGGKFEMAAKPWEAHIAIGRGGRLLTGQNPASAAPLAKKLLEALS